jgi:DNA-binding NtrC family response regulator
VRNKTILIVDDNALLLNLLGVLLKRQGYDVLRAEGPGEALAILTRHASPVDVVLSDIAMPEMRGTELVRKCAQITPLTECLLMTGGIVDASEVPPGVPILRKPILRADLIAAVESAIARSQARQHAEAQSATARLVELSTEGRRLKNAAAVLRLEGCQLRTESEEARHASQQVRHHAQDAIEKSRMQRAGTPGNGNRGRGMIFLLLA